MRQMPFYKTGKDRSYVLFEFVLNNVFYAGGLSTQVTTGTVKGICSSRTLRRKTFEKFVETIINRCGNIDDNHTLIYELEY